jgi:hypothetical protein
MVAHIKYPTEEILKTEFGQLTPVEEIRRNGRRFFKCRCTCGMMRQVELGSLIKGTTQSCGCLKDKVSKRNVLPRIF